MKSASPVADPIRSLPIPARRCVMIAHPGRQHVYETVRAAEEHCLLQIFATGVYLDDRSRLGRGARRLSSLRPGARMLKRLHARSHPAIDADRVIAFPRYLAVSKLTRRLPGSDAISLWADARCDARIARRLATLTPTPKLVHGFEGSALFVLSAARAFGAKTVLDVPNAHERAQIVLAEEGAPTAPAAVTRRVRSERELADRLVVPSPFVADCLAENGIDRGRIVTIPYGVDARRFAPAPAAESQTLRVLFVGFASYRKGLRYLLEAWRRLGLRDAELIIAGDADSFGRALLERHRDFGVIWLGYVPTSELPDLFRRCDVFAFPSLAEGSALVTYEALASGLPVITTASSGSVVRDGLDGFVVPERDADAVAEKIALLSSDTELRRDMGASGRALVESRYTWGHYRARIAELHRGLLEERA